MDCTDEINFYTIDSKSERMDLTRSNCAVFHGTIERKKAQKPEILIMAITLGHRCVQA